MKTKGRIGLAVLAGMVFVGVAQAALVAEWNFDLQTLENSGSTAGNHDGGIFIGAGSNMVEQAASFSTDTPTGSGYALDLSSAVEYMSITNSSTNSVGYVDTFDTAADFSCSMWVKSTDGAWGNWREFGGKGNEAANEGWVLRSRNYIVGDARNGTRVEFYHEGTDDTALDSEPFVNIPDQLWHLVTFTYEYQYSTLTLYIDGVEEGINTSALMSPALGRSLVFGNNENNGTKGTTFLYDSIQFYDNTLSASEIAEMYIPQKAFFVDSEEIDFNLISPGTLATGSVAVSYLADTSVDVAVTISDESHLGAFSLVNTTPLVLTDPSPSNTVLEFAFDNSTVGLMDGESATGLVTIAWNQTGDTEVTEIVLPIRIQYSVPPTGGTLILWDIITTAAASINATVEDFTDAGVTEDLTGASVSHVLGSANTTMTDANGVTLSYASGTARATYQNAATMTGAGAPLIKDYINTRDNGPITMQIGGLSSHLVADSTYSFYLWGIGDSVDQNSTFTFDGIEITVGAGEPDDADASNYMAKYTFTTGLTVPDTLDFIWDDRNQRAALNGFAIVRVPNAAVGRISLEIISGGTEVALRFATSANGIYGVKASDNLAIESSWNNIMTDIPGTGGEVIITNSLSADGEFYRAYLQD
ncbi:hypothetical protein P4C99_07080 [Pontiellaceae bacterium B1224]|nr:hypothetical protein [Pontiellaceae bacterium B1224]